MIPTSSTKTYRKHSPSNGAIPSSDASFFAGGDGDKMFIGGVKLRCRAWLFALLLLIAFSPALSAQTIVKFKPILNGTVLELGAAVVAERSRSAGTKQVEVLRWYLSNIELLRDGEVVFTPKKHHHLFDAEVPESLHLELATDPSLRYDELRFTFGVDSLTAEAGAFGGDLDPTNGMYWTWRSGYINFKLEGTSPMCPARKNRFQFHVGGFQGPFASQRNISLAVTPAEVVQVDLDLDRFFKAVNLQKQYQVMSPNEASAEMANLLAQIFQLHQE